MTEDSESEVAPDLEAINYYINWLRAMHPEALANVDFSRWAEQKNQDEFRQLSEDVKLIAQKYEDFLIRKAKWPRWIEQKFGEPVWHYVDCLLWIAFRSPELMAEHLSHLPSQDISRWYKSDATSVHLFVHLALQSGKGALPRDGREAAADWAAYQPELVETKPKEALTAALKRGAVRALGLLNGQPPLTPIPVEQWQHLHLPPNRPWPPSRLLRDTVDAAYSEPVEENHWFDLRFDRESVMAAFPRVPPDLVSSLVPGQNFDADAWRVQAGETCKAWMARPEVSQEAARRLRDGGTGKTSIPGVLTLMARECGAGFSQETIRKNVKVLRETT